MDGGGSWEFRGGMVVGDGVGERGFVCFLEGWDQVKGEELYISIYTSHTWVLINFTL